MDRQRNKGKFKEFAKVCKGLSIVSASCLAILSTILAVTKIDRSTGIDNAGTGGETLKTVNCTSFSNRSYLTPKFYPVVMIQLEDTGVERIDKMGNNKALSGGAGMSYDNQLTKTEENYFLTDTYYAGSNTFWKDEYYIKGTAGTNNGSKLLVTGDESGSDPDEKKSFRAYYEKYKNNSSLKYGTGNTIKAKGFGYSTKELTTYIWGYGISQRFLGELSIAEAASDLTYNYTDGKYTFRVPGASSTNEYDSEKYPYGLFAPYTGVYSRKNWIATVSKEVAIWPQILFEDENNHDASGMTYLTGSIYGALGNYGNAVELDEEDITGSYADGFSNYASKIKGVDSLTRADSTWSTYRNVNNAMCFTTDYNIKKFIFEDEANLTTIRQLILNKSSGTKSSWPGSGVNLNGAVPVDILKAFSKEYGLGDSLNYKMLGLIADSTLKPAAELVDSYYFATHVDSAKGIMEVKKDTSEEEKSIEIDDITDKEFKEYSRIRKYIGEQDDSYPVNKEEGFVDYGFDPAEYPDQSTIRLANLYNIRKTTYERGRSLIFIPYDTMEYMTTGFASVNSYRTLKISMGDYKSKSISSLVDLNTNPYNNKNGKPTTDKNFKGLYPIAYKDNNEAGVGALQISGTVSKNWPTFGFFYDTKSYNSGGIRNVINGNNYSLAEWIGHANWGVKYNTKTSDSKHISMFYDWIWNRSIKDIGISDKTKSCEKKTEALLKTINGNYKSAVSYKSYEGDTFKKKDSDLTVAELIELYQFGVNKEMTANGYKDGDDDNDVDGWDGDPYFNPLVNYIKKTLDSMASNDLCVANATQFMATMLMINTDTQTSGGSTTYKYSWGPSGYNEGAYIDAFVAMYELAALTDSTEKQQYKWPFTTSYERPSIISGLTMPADGVIEIAADGGKPVYNVVSCSNDGLATAELDIYCNMYIVAKACESSSSNSELSKQFFNAIRELLKTSMYGTIPMGANISFSLGNINISPLDNANGKWATDSGFGRNQQSIGVSMYNDARTYATQQTNDRFNLNKYERVLSVARAYRLANFIAPETIKKSGLRGARVTWKNVRKAGYDPTELGSEYVSSSVQDSVKNGSKRILIRFKVSNDGTRNVLLTSNRHTETTSYKKYEDIWSSLRYSTDAQYILANIKNAAENGIQFADYPMNAGDGNIANQTWLDKVIKLHNALSSSRDSKYTWNKLYIRSDATGAYSNISWTSSANSTTKLRTDSSFNNSPSDASDKLALAKLKNGNSGFVSKTVDSDGSSIKSYAGYPVWFAVAMQQYYNEGAEEGEKMVHTLYTNGIADDGDGFSIGRIVGGMQQGRISDNVVTENGALYTVSNLDAKFLWSDKKDNSIPTKNSIKNADMEKLTHELELERGSEHIDRKALMPMTLSVNGYIDGAKRDKELTFNDMRSNGDGTTLCLKDYIDNMAVDKQDGVDMTSYEYAKALWKAYGKTGLYIEVNTAKEIVEGEESNLIQVTEKSEVTEKKQPKLGNVLKSVSLGPTEKAAGKPIKLTEEDLFLLFGLKTNGKPATKVYCEYYLDFSNIATSLGTSTENNITLDWLYEAGINITIGKLNSAGDGVTSVFDCYDKTEGEPESDECRKGVMYKLGDYDRVVSINVGTLYSMDSDSEFLLKKNTKVKNWKNTDGEDIAKTKPESALQLPNSGLRPYSMAISKMGGDVTKTKLTKKVYISSISLAELKENGKTKIKSTTYNNMYLQVSGKVGTAVDADGQMMYEDTNRRNRNYTFKDETEEKVIGTPVYVNLNFEADASEADENGMTVVDVLNEVFKSYSSYAISFKLLDSAVLEGEPGDDDKLVYSATENGKAAENLKLMYSSNESTHKNGTDVGNYSRPFEISKNDLISLLGVDGKLSVEADDNTATTVDNNKQLNNLYFDFSSMKVSESGNGSGTLANNFKFQATIGIKILGKKAGESSFSPIEEILPDNGDYGKAIVTGVSVDEESKMYVIGGGSSTKAAIEPIMVEWFSIPKTYSEIKEGHINFNGTGSIEHYEAMAGVPSTETLYFTSGGSEYIIEITMGLIQNEMTTRTYTSVFNGTNECEFRLGDKLHGGSGETTTSTEWGRNGDEYVHYNSKNAYSNKVTEWYNIPDPVDTSSKNITIANHDSVSVIKAIWTGSIDNADSDTPSINKNAVGWDPGPGNNAYDDLCATEANSNAPAGDYGEPGAMGNEHNVDFNWDVDKYNSDLTNAYNWAKEMEDISETDKGQIAKLANSDGVTRSWHSGKATIHIEVNNVSHTGENGAKEHTNVQVSGTWYSDNKHTTDTSGWDAYKLESNHDVRLGTTWREVYGDKAHRGSYSGCVESCWELEKYNAQPDKQQDYIASYSGGCENPVTSEYDDPIITDDDGNPTGGGAHHTVYGCNCTHAEVHQQETYKDSWCGATSVWYTNATHSAGSGGTDTYTACTTTGGSAGHHTCTHGCGSWEALVETESTQMSNPTYKIQVTFETPTTKSDDTEKNVDKTCPADTLPTHALCGPCCQHTLPTIYDKWQQEVCYDYMQMMRLNVNKISRSYLTGGQLGEILYSEAEDITANVIQGEPNVFYNIGDMNSTYMTSKYESKKEASLSGRLRYSLQTGQYDNVIWDEKMISESVNGTSATGHGQKTRSYDCDGRASTVSNYNPCKRTADGHFEQPWADGLLYSRGNVSWSANGRQTGSVDASGEVYSEVLRESYKGYTYDPDWYENIRKANGEDTEKKQYSKDTLDKVDVETYEYNRFKERRETKNTCYVISDMIILQTSAGDQSIFYFEKNETAQTQQGFIDDKDLKLDFSITYNDRQETAPESAVNDMWYSNNLSVGKGGHSYVYTYINIGGYLGRGASDKYNKFSRTGTTQVQTIFDVGGKADATRVQLDTKADVPGVQSYVTVNSVTNSLDPNVFKSSPNKGCGFQYRMARPSRPFRTAIEDQQINPVINNQSYNTGNAYQGYINIIDYVAKYEYLPKYWLDYDRNNGYEFRTRLEDKFMYRVEANDVLNGNFFSAGVTTTDELEEEVGVVREAVYEEDKSKINDIIIHTPTTSENAVLISLNSDRDQRTGSLYDDGLTAGLNSSSTACPRIPGQCEYSYLNCRYYQDTVLFSTGFEDNSTVTTKDFNGHDIVSDVKTRYTDDAGTEHIKETNNLLDLELPDGFNIVGAEAGFTGSSGNVLKCNGVRWSIPLETLGITYNANTQLKVDMDIKLNSDISTSKSSMIVSFGTYDFWIPDTTGYGTFNTGNGWEKRLGTPLSKDSGKHLTVIFDFYDIANCKAYINGSQVAITSVNGSRDIDEEAIGKSINIGSWSYDDSYPAQFTIDNLVITKLAGSNTHTAACYKKVYECVNSDYYTCQLPVDFDCKSKVQSFTAPQSGYYRIDAYGASGGGDTTGTNGSRGGLGGEVSGKVYLSEGQTIYLYVGGTTTSMLGGYNGGGQGNDSGFGGGGSSYVSTSQYDTTTVYTISSGLSLRPGTENYYGMACMNANGEGIYGPYISCKAGKTYKITITGSNLTKGYPLVYTNYGNTAYQAGSPYIKNLSITDTKIYYEFEVPSGIPNTQGVDPYTIWEFCYYSTSSESVYIASESVVNMDGILLIAGGGGGADNLGGLRGEGDDGSGGYGGMIAGTAYIDGKESTVTKSGTIPDIPGLVTKYFDGALWARVLYQDIRDNASYFTTSNYMSVNRPTLFSCLDKLSFMKSDPSYYEFMLDYPDSTYGGYNRWRQRLNPLDQRTNDSSNSAGQNAAGYDPIHMDLVGYAGHGIEFNGSACVLDGTVGYNNWWLCCGIMNGSYSPTNSASKPYTMPGPHWGTNEEGTYSCELWVKVGVIAGAGGIQTSGYTMGTGESVNKRTDSGGAGGGYYGGYTTNHNNGGAGGGSSYISGGVMSSSNSSGANIGDGKITITLVDHSHTSKCAKETTLNNLHTHSESCIEDSDFLESLIMGANTTGDTNKLRKYLGNTVANSLIRPTTTVATISGSWNYLYAVSGCTVNKGSNLIITASGNDPYIMFNCDIEAKAISEVQVDYYATGISGSNNCAMMYHADANHGFTTGDYWLNSSTRLANGYGTIKYATSGANGWSGEIKSLRFDLPDGGSSNGSKITITAIRFIGVGTGVIKNGTPQGDLASGSRVFSYTGGQQAINLGAGTYSIVLNGAAGGNDSGIGGTGGTTTGTLTVPSLGTYYINVGGVGTFATNAGGGYNGGGNAGPSGTSGGGGGATSIATVSGTLPQLMSNASSRTSVVAVAGGGGGAGYGVTAQVTKVGPILTTVADFGYTGSYQSVTLQPGTYLLEAWGASDGNNSGQGGYTSGQITLTSAKTLYVYVGQQGDSKGTNESRGYGYGQYYSFNGGGSGNTLQGGETWHMGSSGGGATDFRLTSGTWDNMSGLYSRILVAGGGGGTGCASVLKPTGNGGGYAGGTTYNNESTAYYGFSAYGGSQTGGGYGGRLNGCTYSTPMAGSFGKGSHATTCGAGGGGGYYGGGSNFTAGGGGGSSYIAGYPGCDTSFRANQEYMAFTSGTMRQGGNIGHGKARVSMVNNGSIYTGTSNALIKVYGYTGGVQSVTLQPGTYTLECFGAQGGQGYNSIGAVGRGGLGGYSTGTVTYASPTTLYLYVGQQGYSYTGPQCSIPGAFNGGGAANPSDISSCNYETRRGGGGGGATDIRTGTSLYNRIIVAGGGGGGACQYTEPYVYGAVGGDGGTTGGTGTSPNSNYYSGTGGGRYGAGSNKWSGAGGFGQGGNGCKFGTGFGAGGGGGYYGGGGGYGYQAAGGGGSSYIDGVSNGSTISGVNKGNGYIVITCNSADRYENQTFPVQNGGNGGGYSGYNGGGSNFNSTYNGLGATPSNYYALGQGQNKTTGDGGGGGGGYYGGFAALADAGAGGGAGYVNTSVVSSYNSYANGSNTGHGSVTITAINVESDPGEIIIKAVDPLYVTSDEAGISSALGTIKSGFSTVPEKVDEELNPIFTCSNIPNVHVCQPECFVPKLVLECDEPHHAGEHYEMTNPVCWSACNDDNKHAIHSKPKQYAGDGTGRTVEVRRGDFVNLDYGFTVYFPNMGDFQGTDAYGIKELTTDRGIGYTNNMDTTRWLREKLIMFEFDTLFYNEKTALWEFHKAGEWIELPISTQDDETRDWKTEQAGIAIEYYDFYCMLNNTEAEQSKIEFRTEAINCDQDSETKEQPYLKNDWLDYTLDSAKNNSIRTQRYTANEGSVINDAVDLVGRIGNMLITDTDDQRYCNFFKKINADEWLIEPLINKVYEDQQRGYLAISDVGNGTGIDVRGAVTMQETQYFNTWGTEGWSAAPEYLYTLPVSSGMNNITQLQKEELKPGYDVYWEISTIGSYSQLQVAPYFYAYDTQTGQIKPIDVWYQINNSYRAINIYNLLANKNLDIYKLLLNDREAEITDPKWTALKEFGLDNYLINLDWGGEKGRRNVSADEVAITNEVAIMHGTVEEMNDGSRVSVPLATPYGNSYTLGTLQFMTPGERARTFIGSKYTYTNELCDSGLGAQMFDKFGLNKLNPFNGEYKTDLEDQINTLDFAYQARRWHLKLGLPSGAVFVLYDENKGHVHPMDYADGTDKYNMDILKEKDANGTSRYVILMAANINALGSTWDLKYELTNQVMKVRSSTITLPADMPPVIAAYDSVDASTVDIQIIGTH